MLGGSVLINERFISKNSSDLSFYDSEIFEISYFLGLYS
jgi:hypothetical protein